MKFRKNHYRIGRYINRFGKNILITDITDWTTDEIVQASLDRWAVEDGFRLTKDEAQVASGSRRVFQHSLKLTIFAVQARFNLK